MNIGLFVAVAILLALGSVIAWRASGPAGSPRDPSTPVRLTILVYLVMYGAGSLILIVTGDSRGPGPLLAGFGLLAFGVGVWLASRFFGKVPARTPEAADGPDAHQSFRPWVVVALAAVGLAAVAVLVAQHGIPLLARDPQLSRSGFAGPLFDLFRWLVPPAALVAFAVALASGQARDRWIAGAALGGVAGLEMALASRALPAELAIGALLIAQHGIPLLARDPQLSRSGFAGPLFDVFRWLVPPAALVAFAVALASGQPRDRWIAGAALGGVAGLEMALASRALPLELAIGALLIAWWAGRRLSLRLAAALGAAALVLFVGVQLLRVGPEGGFSGAADVAGFAVRRTIDRVLLIHPQTLDLVARDIPRRQPYFGGSTYVRRLAVLLGKKDKPALGYWIYERLFPGETGGFAAPGVLGEAWANGGPVLSVVLMLMLGVLAQVAGRRVASLPRGPTNLAFAALVSVAIARSYATNLNGMLITLAVTTAWWIATTPRGRPPIPSAAPTESRQ